MHASEYFLVVIALACSGDKLVLYALWPDYSGDLVFGSWTSVQGHITHCVNQFVDYE